MPRPYPPEFRRRAIARVKSGRTVATISVQSNIAFESPTLVFQCLQLSSSICMLDQNDSIIASSSQLSTVPNDGFKPALRMRSVGAHDVN